MIKRIIPYFIAGVCLFGSLYGCGKKPEDMSHQERLEAEQLDQVIRTLDGKEYRLSLGGLAFITDVASQQYPAKAEFAKELKANVKKSSNREVSEKEVESAYNSICENIVMGVAKRLDADGDRNITAKEVADYKP